VILLIGFSCNAAAADAEIEAVKEILNRPRVSSSKSACQEHAEDLKSFGDSAIPLLASLLNEFSFVASQTMLEIDSNKAGPLLFSSMPKSDHFVQFFTFSFFIQSMNKGEKLPFARELHDAAVRCLEAGTDSDAAEMELIAIGFTGSDSDYPLLEHIYESHPPMEAGVVIGLKAASAGALARLGHEKYLKEIEVILAEPIPARIPPTRAAQLQRAMSKAGFSQNPRFIPLLARHLGDPVAEEPPAVFPALDPGWAARVALYEIVNHTSSSMGLQGIDYGGLDKWWKENKQKFRK
jgi:hypothetical protein